MCFLRWTHCEKFEKHCLKERVSFNEFTDNSGLWNFKQALLIQEGLEWALCLKHPDLRFCEYYLYSVQSLDEAGEEL